jgi:phosphoglycerate dehydrogenase-like enzyme
MIPSAAPLRTSTALPPMPATLLVREEFRGMVFSSALAEEISEIAGVAAPWVDPEALDPAALHATEVLFCTWGTPVMDEAFLRGAPHLKAVFYAAGSTKNFLTPAVFERGIVVTSAASANAVPVAEFTIAAIIFGLKQALPAMRAAREQREWIKPEQIAAGGYRSRVGLVSLGEIGRRVAHGLGALDLDVVASDPLVSSEDAEALGARLCSLEELFSTCDVVSLHTPLLPATTGMITGALIASMKPHATFINTARGAIVRENELCTVLAQRPDITAILDVTENEPPFDDSPLWTLPNVFLTPHLSGSIGPECRRMARFAVDEFRRYRAGEPLLYKVQPERLDTTA